MGVEMDTPWGRGRVVQTICPGLVFVETASHGGYFVSEALRALVPAAVVEATWNGNGHGGWYEEDCDALFITVLWSRWFPEQAVEAAKRVLIAMATRPHEDRERYALAVAALGLRAAPLAVPTREEVGAILDRM